MSDLASDLSEFSLLICAFREDLDCSISNALSLRAALDLDLEREGEGAREERVDD